MVEHVPKVLDSGGDDAGATGSADDVVKGIVIVVTGNYSRGDGGHGAFVRPDIVGWGRGVAEWIGDVRKGKV